MTVSRISRAMEGLRTLRTSWGAGPAARKYIRHQSRRRRNQGAGGRKKGIVLASFCATPAVIHCYAEFLPRFARELDSSLGAFHLHHSAPDPLASAIYSSFGARICLRARRQGVHWEKAEKRSQEIFQGLRSKSDVSHIREEGVWLGDLIYDSYLRDLLLATVDIKDPRLLSLIRDALHFLYCSEEFFENHTVKSVFVDHLVYIWQGVLQRVAMNQRIPIYTVYFKPRPSVQRLDLVARADGMEVPARFYYWHYPEVFSRLSPDKQAAAREAGRQYIQHRIDGGVQNNILGGQSAYAVQNGERVLENTGVPKLLVLLHDFCDAVHVYRSLLFDDFYEWIHFLLKEASKTPFEWYVKPHPNMNDYRRRKIQNSNLQVIEELKAEYPKIRFLEPTVSNGQLIRDGLAGIFTMHGTATHEFPFLGIPAVCGADNPHAEYPFALTPSSVEEYAGLIKNAGNLGNVRGAERIPEFCYMHFFYAAEHMGAPTTLFDPMPAPGQGSEEIYSAALKASTPAADAILDRYVCDLLEGKTPSCVM